jgi:hypothetical protein
VAQAAASAGTTIPICVLAAPQIAQVRVPVWKRWRRMLERPSSSASTSPQPLLVAAGCIKARDVSLLLLPQANAQAVAQATGLAPGDVLAQVKR